MSAGSPIRTPPLRLLRAFFFAGKHSSFKAAAERLALTPSAVSHQVKELEEQLGEFHTLVVANGGGGFVAGQAAWFRDRVKIVSVEPELSQCLRPALLAGERVPVKVGGIAADSLGAQLGEVPWAISKHFVDESVLVTDDDIRAAQKALWNDLRLVVEPGGAAAYAALMTGAVQRQDGERMVVVVCGSNCDPTSVL